MYNPQKVAYHQIIKVINMYNPQKVAYHQIIKVAHYNM